MKAKNFFHTSHRQIGTTCPVCAAFGSVELELNPGPLFKILDPPLLWLYGLGTRLEDAEMAGASYLLSCRGILCHLYNINVPPVQTYFKCS